MAAFDGAEVALPELFACVRHGAEFETLRGAPGEIYTIRIGRRGAGSKAVFLVVPMMFRLVINRPNRLSGMGMNRDGAAGTVFFVGTEKKHVFAPNDGRPMTSGWQWSFPFKMGISPLDGEGSGADPMALRAAESGPLLFCEQRHGAEGEEGQNDVSGHVRNLSPQNGPAK